MKYKVGDEVRIKGTDIGGTIASIIRGQLIVETKGSKIPVWPEEVVLIEGLVEEETNDCEKCGLTRNSTRCLFMDNCLHNKHKNIIEIPEDYVLKDENGNVINATKIVLEKKKKGYPKTYEECCKILGCKPIVGFAGLDDDEENLYVKFIALKRCRDAYWKIAGEEMGLGKPWKPDWKSLDPQYIILYQYGGIDKAETHGEGNYILTFPTAEMRDAFKENFDPDIKICKELL